MRLISKAGMGAAVLAAAMFAPTPAQAISFTDGDEACRLGQPPTQDADALAACGFTGLTLLYKDDGSETGPFADDYSASFTSTGGTITWDGPDTISCPTCYLVVKDGSIGGWYIFDLNGPPAWDGQETITLSGLYPNGGSISHLSIWGGEGDGGGDGPGEGPVPEPASLLLLGTALTAAGLRMRRARC